MFSLKNPIVRVVAITISVVTLILGVYMTFFNSVGYTVATIISITEDTNYMPETESPDDIKYIVMVKYTVDSYDYATPLDSYYPDYKIGDEVRIRYNRNFPQLIKSGVGAGVYILIAGFVVLLSSILLTRKWSFKKIRLKTPDTDKEEQLEL